MGFEYDFAISYASDVRDLAVELADKLSNAGHRVFYDRREEQKLTGLDAKAALARIYAQASRVCVLLLSKGYELSEFTAIERDAILSRERIDPTNFVIPVLVRGTPPEWLGKRRLRIDLEHRTIAELMGLLFKRAAQLSAVRAQPEILWSAMVGIGTWKHEPIPRGDFVYVASAGTRWNEVDELDGVHCLRGADGVCEWHFRTDADANAILLDDGVLFVGTDAGTVYAVDAETGAERWSTQGGGGPILAKPLVIGDRVITFSAEGAVRVFDRQTGKMLWGDNGGFVLSVHGGVVADPVTRGDAAFVVTRAGVVIELPLENAIPTMDQNPREFPQRSLRLTTWSQFELDGRRSCQFHATPVVLDELLFLPHVRDTTYAGVPVAAIERRRMLERFTIAETNDPNRNFGNVRARPVVCEGLVIVPVAYGNEVVAFDRAGRISWIETCGVPHFYQWGSPAAYGTDVLIPRFDGFVHAVRARDGAKRWSMFLGGGDQTGKVYIGNDCIPGENADASWDNPLGDSINAPISVAGDKAYVHTSGGTLYAIGLPPMAEA